MGIKSIISSTLAIFTTAACTSMQPSEPPRRQTGELVKDPVSGCVYWQDSANPDARRHCIITEKPFPRKQ